MATPTRSACRALCMLLAWGALFGCSSQDHPSFIVFPDSAPSSPADLARSVDSRQGPDQAEDGDATLVGSEDELGMPRLRITMVDVGQGDGLVLQMPGGHVVALDGGPSAAAGNAHDAYLTAQGLTMLDAIVLTHSHSDHVNGLLVALARLPQDCNQRVFDPGFARMGFQNYTNFVSMAGCRYHPVMPGDSLDLDPQVEVRVVSAYQMYIPPGADDSEGINNTSAVLRVRFGKFSMLLEGDSQSVAEQATYMHQGAALRSTVIKLGHHGSCNATGTTYLKAVQPQFALMSMSSGNSYGHPHCQTISKLKQTSAVWLRTDVNGTVTVASDGTHFAVTNAKGDRSVETCPRNCSSPTDF